VRGAASASEPYTVYTTPQHATTAQNTRIYSNSNNSFILLILDLHRGCGTGGGGGTHRRRATFTFDHCQVRGVGPRVVVCGVVLVVCCVFLLCVCVCDLGVMPATALDVCIVHSKLRRARRVIRDHTRTRLFLLCEKRATLFFIARDSASLWGGRARVWVGVKTDFQHRTLDPDTVHNVQQTAAHRSTAPGHAPCPSASVCLINVLSIMLKEAQGDASFEGRGYMWVRSLNLGGPRLVFGLRCQYPIIQHSAYAHTQSSTQATHTVRALDFFINYFYCAHYCTRCCIYSCMTYDVAQVYADDNLRVCRSICRRPVSRSILLMAPIACAYLPAPSVVQGRRSSQV